MNTIYNASVQIQARFKILTSLTDPYTSARLHDPQRMILDSALSDLSPKGKRAGAFFYCLFESFKRSQLYLQLIHKYDSNSTVYKLLFSNP